MAAQLCAAVALHHPIMHKLETRSSEFQKVMLTKLYRGLEYYNTVQWEKVLKMVLADLKITMPDIWKKGYSEQNPYVCSNNTLCVMM